MTYASHELRWLDHDECARLLAGDSVGRLAIVVGGAPHIFPVNYVFDGESIVFRTGPGTKLNAAGRSPASFEVDAVDRTNHLGWSVVAHGRLEEVTTFDARTQRSVETLPVDPWAGGSRPTWMRLIPRFLTGRRIVEHVTAAH